MEQGLKRGDRLICEEGDNCNVFTGQIYTFNAYVIRMFTLVEIPGKFFGASRFRLLDKKYVFNVEVIAAAIRLITVLRDTTNNHADWLEAKKVLDMLEAPNEQK